jgi:hypothetical protein
MHVLTTSESLDGIKAELVFREAKAARRGLPLAARWEQVKEALRSGRLVERLPSGAKLISRAVAESHALRMVRQAWNVLTKGARGPLILAGKSLDLVLKLPGVRTGFKIVGKGVIVLDYVANGYLTYVDYQRWQDGEINGGYFAFKSLLRAAQSGLTTWAICGPDPTTVSKWIAGSLALVLTVVDLASDPIYEAAQSRTRELLGSLERDERYYHSRHEILRQMDSVLNLSEQTSKIHQ